MSYISYNQLSSIILKNIIKVFNRNLYLTDYQIIGKKEKRL
jgi:hypothetical protein